jgi:hypothetical protein
VRFRPRRPVVADTDQQAVNDGVYVDLNAVAQFITWGTGAPAHTPTGPQLYFRRDYGVNTAVYSWDGSWKSVT